MNTRIAPFDSEEARRALAYSLDRSEIVRITTGPQLSQPTCQILPPNFPGYKPYCPYTLRPVAAAAGLAPDLAKGRMLITQSGTRGKMISVVSGPDHMRNG